VSPRAALVLAVKFERLDALQEFSTAGLEFGGRMGAADNWVGRCAYAARRCFRTVARNLAACYIRGPSVAGAATSGQPPHTGGTAGLLQQHGHHWLLDASTARRRRTTVQVCSSEPCSVYVPEVELWSTLPERPGLPLRMGGASGLRLVRMQHFAAADARRNSARRQTDVGAHSGVVLTSELGLGADIAAPAPMCRETACTVLPAGTPGCITPALEWLHA